MWQAQSLEVRKEGIVSLRQVLHKRIYPVLGVMATSGGCAGDIRDPEAGGDGFWPCAFLFA